MGWLTYKQLETVFPEGAIVRKPHHRDFSTRRGGNQFRIAKTAIRSALATPQLYWQLYYSLGDFKSKTNWNIHNFWKQWQQVQPVLIPSPGITNCINWPYQYSVTKSFEICVISAWEVCCTKQKYSIQFSLQMTQGW